MAISADPNVAALFECLTELSVFLAIPAQLTVKRAHVTSDTEVCRCDLRVDTVWLVPIRIFDFALGPQTRKWMNGALPTAAA